MSRCHQTGQILCRSMTMDCPQAGPIGRLLREPLDIPMAILGIVYNSEKAFFRGLDT